MRRSLLALCGLGVWVLSGCAPADDAASDARPSGDAPSRAVASSGADAASGGALDAGGLLRGVVRETIAVPPYVYLRLDTRAGETWAAVAEAPVSVGDSVTVFNAMAMEQFTSTTLQRTFARLWFGALEPPANGVHGTPGASMSAGAPPVIDARIAPIAPATGDDARTVEALWAEKERLVGQTVRVRGVVAKANLGVMSKNWLHLQDGSGDPTLGTHDLTVTTDATAAVGDTVTVTGVVAINRDVGAGYTYALLLEDGRLVRR